MSSISITGYSHPCEKLVIYPDPITPAFYPGFMRLFFMLHENIAKKMSDDRFEIVGIN